MMIFAISILEIVLLLIVFGVGMFSAANEKIWGVIAAFAILFIGFYIIWGSAPFLAVHWLTYVAGFFGYFLIGGLYTLVFSWPNYIKRNKDSILAIKKEWDADRGIRLGYTDWRELNRFKTKYTAAEQKGRIVGYICGWFWDFSWKILKNPIKWTYDTVYNLFGRGYEHVARKTVNKIVGEE